MNWIVLVAGRAKKELRRLPKKDEGRIRVVLREFEIDPHQGDIEKIVGEKFMWRRRIGAYRILYEVFSNNKLVRVFRIERRTTTTYSHPS